jgi:hypothetical protein
MPASHVGKFWSCFRARVHCLSDTREETRVSPVFLARFCRMEETRLSKAFWKRACQKAERHFRNVDFCRISVVFLTCEFRKRAVQVRKLVFRTHEPEMRFHFPKHAFLPFSHFLLAATVAQPILQPKHFLKRPRTHSTCSHMCQDTHHPRCAGFLLVRT